MNHLFRLAAESMLKVYGREAVLIHRIGAGEPIRVSPLFSAKIRRDDSSSRQLNVDANVIISGNQTIPDVNRDQLQINEKLWTILTAKEICPGIYELELKQ